MSHDHELYLAPTDIIDSDHPIVRDHARKVVGESTDRIEQAVRLYLAVRDGIRYDPYASFSLPEHYRASNVLKRGRGFCIPKASLLCALGRACGIPSRLGFATVRNHLATKELLDFLGSDIFVYHAFVEFLLAGKWVKATPAFNRELCIRHNVAPLEFNGREDSLFQPYNAENRKYMEYLGYSGTYADVPVDVIVDGWKKHWGEERVARWMEMFAEKDRQGDPESGFYSESVWSE